MKGETKTEVRTEYVIVHHYSDGSTTEYRVRRVEEGTISVEPESGDWLWFHGDETARSVANAIRKVVSDG